jgi:hypothetical protein
MSESESISCGLMLVYTDSFIHCCLLFISANYKAAMFSRRNPELDPLGHDFRDTDRPSSASTVPKFKNININNNVANRITGNIKKLI